MRKDTSITNEPSFLPKAGVQDYQTFTKSLGGLEGWITQSEELLKAQDPSHSSDLSTIRNRMEELKVSIKKKNLTFYFQS